MNIAEVDNTLSSYGNLDGALVLKFQFDLGPTRETRSALVELKAFRNSPTKGKGDWRKLRITALGNAMFSWREMSWDSNLVLTWPVKVIGHSEIVIIDFDPLHSITHKTNVNLSGYFLGGAKILCEEF